MRLRNIKEGAHLRSGVSGLAGEAVQECCHLLAQDRLRRTELLTARNVIAARDALRSQPRHLLVERVRLRNIKEGAHLRSGVIRLAGEAVQECCHLLAQDRLRRTELLTARNVIAASDALRSQPLNLGDERVRARHVEEFVPDCAFGAIRRDGY